MPPLAQPWSGPAASSGGPLMLIGGSEALGGMQISPALLRYPSVPLPVLFNPLIPPDWRREEHSCWFVASFPWAPAVSRESGEGGLIRGWASRPMSCTVHQRRSASQPESQMTPSTCTGLPNSPHTYTCPPRPPLLFPPFISHLPHYLLLAFLLTLTCSSLSLAVHPPPSFISPASQHPPPNKNKKHILYNPQLPRVGSEKATC